MHPTTKSLVSSLVVSCVGALLCHFVLGLAWENVIAYLLGTIATTSGVMLCRVPMAPKTLPAKHVDVRARIRSQRNRFGRTAVPNV